MNKSFIIKAHLLEEGVNISDSGKKHLDKNSDIWLMNDYITSSGVTLKFLDQYVTTKVSSSSSYILVEVNGQLQLVFNDESINVDVIYPPDYMHDTIIIGGKSIRACLESLQKRKKGVK